jgi:hypothetical protein
MNPVRAKIYELRLTAKCRCDAVNKKLRTAAESVNKSAYYHPCCWVCCDCTLDAFEGEWIE